MKRVISLALVICLVLFLLTPAVFALTLPDDLVVLELQDYFVKSEMVADFMVSEYSFSTDSMVFQYNNKFGLLEQNSYSFGNATGSNVNNNGFFVSYSTVPSGVNYYLNSYNGNELFSATDIPSGAYVSFEFPYVFSSDYSGSQGWNIVGYVNFYNASGTELSTGSSIYSGCFDVSDSLSGLTYNDQTYSTISRSTTAGIYDSVYSLSCYLPDETSYFTIAFGVFIPVCYNGCNYSFSFGDCKMRVEGTPYPTQPAISYNWSDTGAATYSLGTTTGSPLQVHVTNPQSYGSYSYQWYSGQFNKYDSDHLYGYGTAIEGATSAVYMPPVDHLGTYWYYCIVGHESGDNMAYTHTSDCLVTVVDPSFGGSGVDPTDPSDPSGGGSGTDPGGDSTDTTDPSDPSGGGSGDDSGGDSGGDATTPSSGNEEVVEGIEEANSWLERVVQGITNLPDKILDGIKSLFVPDAESMAEYKDQWEALLQQRFGAIYESVKLIDDFATSLRSDSLKGTITFPSVELNLAGTHVVFGGWEVDVVPAGFEFLIEVLKKIISMVATLAFINSMRRKFEMILGGSE